jgi:RND superfamily putative drug exporter
MPAYGPIGRLGRYTATHVRLVAAVWIAIAAGLGFFAPRVETALSGAGWEATGRSPSPPASRSTRASPGCRRAA